MTLGGRWFTRKPPYWVHNRAENQLLLSIHHLDGGTVDQYIERIREFRPAFLQGQPNGIHFVAARLLAREARLDVPAVFTTGETLSVAQRRDIEEAFNARVYESYGPSESAIAAQQCEHGSFHNMSELGIMEFVRDAETGLYRILGTSLWNDVMPLIRYRIDDLVELAPQRDCPCGRRLPVEIRSIIGRVDDILQAVDGRAVLPVTIRMSINPLLEPFESYQFRQLAPGRYALLLTGVVGKERVDRFARSLRDVLGESAEITVEQAVQLRTSAGKLRTVVNLCEQAREVGGQ